MGSTWTRETCRECGVTNWVPLGDTQGDSPDVDAYECWKCKKIVLLDPSSLQELWRRNLDWEAGEQHPH